MPEDELDRERWDDDGGFEPRDPDPSTDTYLGDLS
jgi:hypothetical protein